MTKQTQSSVTNDLLRMPQGPVSTDAVDFLVQLSQQLWREASYEKLLARFMDIQREYFAASHAAVFMIRSVGAPLSLEVFPIELKGLAGFSSELTKNLESTLSSLTLKSAEFRLGHNRLAVGTDHVHIGLLGDPATEWYLLAWQEHADCAQEVRAAANLYNDFLVRQLQSASVWFQRLDKTQALLYRDDLTGVFNSRYLDVAIDSEIRRSQRFQTSFCLLFIDLDNFKMINDKFGHLSGSSVLKQLSDVLRETSREVDSVIRFGGDEFVILLLGATPSTGVLAGERMRRRIEETRFMLDDGNYVSLTASIGVAAFPDHATDRESLLKLSDEMMYSSKRMGKNRVTLAKGSEKSAAATDVLAAPTVK